MMDDETTDHPGPLCRLCAHTQTHDNLVYIYSDKDENQDCLADFINLNLPIKVSPKDPFPKQICQLCVEKLQATHEFALQCLAAEQELEDLFLDERFRSSQSIQGNKSSEVKDETDNLLQECIDLDGSGRLAALSHDNDCVGGTSLDKYQCPLCCEGSMGSCIEEPRQIIVRSKTPPHAQTFEEKLMEEYKRANEDDDSSLSVVEEDSDAAAEDELEEADQIETNHNDPIVKVIAKSEKKLKQKRGKRKRRLAKRGKDAVVSRRVKAVGDSEETDTLIWIKADNEQSIPLVQCIHCSGWLPGYGSCLQHSLTSHIDVNQAEEKTFHCARCEGISAPSPSELIMHFKEAHCPNHDFEIEEVDGQFTVVDKSKTKSQMDTRSPRDITYYCCICEKGFDWLLNLLRHSCSQVNCNEMYCNICDQNYRNRQRFVFHMNFHSEKAPPLECDVCHQSFEDDCLLYNHVRFAHSTENVVCSECGKHFSAQKGLAAHQLSAHNTDPHLQQRHKCTVCGKFYRDKQGLKEHLVTHMSEKPFACDKCDKAYNRYSRLKQHQLSHLYTETMECFECVDCGLVYPDMDKAVEHSNSEDHDVQSTILSKVFRCEFCDTVFSCSDGLNQHRPSHVGEKPYICLICGSCFHTYSRVTTHKTTHGIYDQIEPQEGDFTIPRHFLCEHCDVSYPYWSYLQTHRKMRHSENPYTLSCKQCPEKFKNSWSVVYHRRKVHEQGGNAKEWRKRSLQCPHCGVNCMYQHTLNMHIERKHGSAKNEDSKGESYQCEECGKVFKYQASLVLHQKSHQGQKNFQCEECDKSFLTIATLRNHTKRCHQGIKPHQCEFCGKAFFHRVTRDDHLRVHTGEKPFKCEFCERSFRLKSMLADHAKIHNDHRPYPCDVCGSSFRRMVHMKQHRMLHTGEKPFQCRYCGQDFRLKQELQRHMKTKHGEAAAENVEEDEFIFADS